MEEQNKAKRQAESNIILQKLIRLDCKDSNFHFRDQLRKTSFKVAYPHTNIESINNDGLLRQFWHHVQAYYFKKIENDEIKRLNYISLIFKPEKINEDIQDEQKSVPFPNERDFWQDVYDLFDGEYLNRFFRGQKMEIEDQNWFKWLFVNWKFTELQRSSALGRKKQPKIIYSKLKENRRQRQLFKTKKLYQQSLEEEKENLDKIIQNLNDSGEEIQSEIDREIRQLEEEMGQITLQNYGIIEELAAKIQEQSIQKKENKLKIGVRRRNGKGYQVNSQRNMEINLGEQLECVEYIIRCLQEKQIAESVSKIISCERSNGQIRFQITFQKAMNIESKFVTQEELNRINFLRETSLVNYYRTGVKSLYSFICHDYVGFRELCQSRTNLSKIKDKCHIQLMKKGACLSSLAQIQNEMARFNTCHHCKYLYPEYLLVTCKFTSDKQAIPKCNMEASCDPNLAEVIVDGANRNRASQRFMTRKKNCLTSYAKIHDEYVCGRKYCFACIKDSYANDAIRENGNCPFCEGTCICTRCLRNQKIVKFKNMYTILGGDINKIQSDSDIEQIQTKNDQQMPRGRGRPKKFLTNSHIIVNKVHKKLKRFYSKQKIVSAYHVPISKNRRIKVFPVKNKNRLKNPKFIHQVDTNDTVQVKRGRGRPSLKSKMEEEQYIKDLKS